MSQAPRIREKICQMGDLHVALCVCPVGGAEFLGYFGIFRERPPSFFAPGSVAKGTGRFCFSSSEGALIHVEKMANEMLQRLRQPLA
jgi:hypothetical protein